MAIHSSGHVAVIDQSGWLLLLRADSPVPLWSLLARSGFSLVFFCFVFA